MKRSPHEWRLTEREAQILPLVAKGASSKDIGAALGISFNTVSDHINNIVRKTGAGNRMDAALTWAGCIAEAERANATLLYRLGLALGRIEAKKEFALWGMSVRKVPA